MIKKIDYTNLKNLLMNLIESGWEELLENYWNVRSVKKNKCLEQELSNPEYVEKIDKV